MNRITLLGILLLLFASCVSKKKLADQQSLYQQLTMTNNQTQADLKKCQQEAEESTRKKIAMQGEIDNLNKQVVYLKENNNNVLGQLKDLSVISTSQAESIKKSLENMGSKDNYIQTLQQTMARKDSLNMALVLNLKSALSDVNDKDVEIKVEKGVVFISIADKLLFASGKFEVTPQASVVLGKVAQVLNSRPEIEFMVEGHTDNVPYKSTCLLDNWDLSVMRATSITKILTKSGVSANQIIAAGKGEYSPLAINDSPQNKQKNRRTEIIVTPNLDELFKILGAN